MGKLIRSIREAKSVVNKELVASTVRISKDMHDFIEELANHYSLSRQEVMSDLIELGADEAGKEMKDAEKKEQEKSDFNEDKSDFKGGSNFYLLNTDKRSNRHDEMLRSRIAAAFSDPWKKNINRIQKGDVVFLYENGKGIVAYGEGTGETLKKDDRGVKDNCYYQELQSFTPLKEDPLSAKEIKNILDRKIPFLQTMICIKDGHKILDEINSRPPKSHRGVRR